MTEQEIKGEDYRIFCDYETTIIKFEGDLSLEGVKEYQPIIELLENVASNASQQITLDLKELSFLNSSGISMLSKFVLSFRNNNQIQLVILGSDEMPWQKKSLKNLKKLLPNLTLEIN
ncbi:STAS domain-containing protein [Crocosphaera sp. UHCC 0190]|uniref:slr1659 superfamily regulator n=1 Tax=Crocosphaera sp. UHCC 0190 TaxID=3110246 RepID=UPI002B201E93|nr:STAS domain-containing protein [Crocosphaera sp. UHCC 0190]MEA5511390.1 STAS domain-containing protein [Crocosphaera sp. UHCC 0190]